MLLCFKNSRLLAFSFFYLCILDLHFPDFTTSSPLYVIVFCECDWATLGAFRLFVVFCVFFPFHSSILEPRFHLGLVQAQGLSEFGPARRIQVLLLFKRFLQNAQLEISKHCARFATSATAWRPDGWLETKVDGERVEDLRAGIWVEKE